MIERIAGGARFVAAVAADVVGRAVEAADIVALLFLHMRTASVVLLVEDTTLPVSGVGKSIRTLFVREVPVELTHFLAFLLVSNSGGKTCRVSIPYKPYTLTPRDKNVALPTHKHRAVVAAAVADVDVGRALLLLLLLLRTASL
jgi:hypothetical protein